MGLRMIIVRSSQEPTVVSAMSIMYARYKSGIGHSFELLMTQLLA